MANSSKPYPPEDFSTPDLSGIEIDISGVDLGPTEEREFYEEIDLSSCPYYQGTGHCQSGCTTEPECMTNEPLEGWPSRRSHS